MDAGEPVVLLGDSGTGKSHLLIGLGLAACEQGRRVRYITTAQLVNELVEAADERVLSRVVARYGRLDLLCLDELGYVQIDPRGAELLFQIITEREERASVAIATNLPFSEWGTVAPTHASSRPSSTASPSTPTSSKPAPSPTGYAPAEPPPDANKPADKPGPQFMPIAGARSLDETQLAHETRPGPDPVLRRLPSPRHGVVSNPNRLDREIPGQNTNRSTNQGNFGLGTGSDVTRTVTWVSANLDVRHTGRFPRSRSEWIVVRSRLRFAAGVCVLAAGLLVGGGAVAVADPDLGGNDGTNAPVQGGPTAGSPVGKVTDTVRETVQGVTSTPGSGTQPGQQPSTGPTSTLGSGRQPGQQPSTGPTSPPTEAGADTEAGLVPADPNPVAAVPNVVAPVTDAVVPPVTEVVAPVTDVVAPVTDAVVPPVTGVVAPVTNVIAPVTGVVAPVTNVIAPGQDMLTSVPGAVVPLMQQPSDLSSFLLGIAGVAPVENGSGGIHGPGLSVAAGASPVPLALPFAGVSGVPLADDATRVGTLDVIALSRVSALSEMAPLASDGASPESSFRHVFEFLLIASLWALAAVALPGVCGLVILTVIGVRIGYGGPRLDSHRGLRALRASPVLGAVKRWMSSR